jgi:hypothetical protein
MGFNRYTYLKKKVLSMIQIIDYKLIILKITFRFATHSESSVVGQMTRRNVENQWKTELPTMVCHNLLRRLAKRNSVVVHIA